MEDKKYLNCPRSQLVRDNYLILNGVWDFAFDKENKGESLKYQNGFKKEYDILVPFTYQTKMSGIGITERCDYVWYQRKFSIKKEQDKKYLLHLEGADYVHKVFLNEQFVGSDRGAYHRHTYDLTSQLKDGDNLLVIKCEDDYSVEKPRGKQRSRDQNYECWYVDTTGLYKSIWLEIVNETYLEHVKMTPFLNEKKICFDLVIQGSNASVFEVNLIENNQVLEVFSHKIDKNEQSCCFEIKHQIEPWSVENPKLYELELLLKNKQGKIIDKVYSYVGFRHIEAKDGFIYLNGQKLYQKLVLDQGYWKDSSLTPPTIEALKEDIVLMKEFGFNGCRKHEKTEDERFLFYCDCLGYLLWEELPSFYKFSEESKKNYFYELPFVLRDNYNHPCIITWTLFNESWGVNQILNDKEQQDFVNEMYHFVKKYDPYRFAITNDGWVHTLSDIITIHHYCQDGDKLYSFYKDKELTMTQEVWTEHHNGAFAKGYKYNGQPVIISEFGGTAFIKNTHDGSWGYGVGVKDDKEYVERLTSLFKGIQRIDYVSGYCYTQVSDVEQEVNGLLNHDHKPKIDPQLLKKVQ